jgi:hypothetical protein
VTASFFSQDAGFVRAFYITDFYLVFLLSQRAAAGFLTALLTPFLRWHLANDSFGYGFGAETEEKLSFGVVSVTAESHSTVSVTVSVTAVTSGWFRRFLVWDSPDLSALNVDVFERYYLH